MYLLVCTLEEGVSREKFENVVAKASCVKTVTWLNGQNGKAKEIKNTPMVGGTLSSLFRYQEQEVLLAQVEGKENVEGIVNHINNIDEVKNGFKYFVVPLVA